MSTEVRVTAIPNCDICKHTWNAITPAAYDGATRMGPWANMCEDCFQCHGVGLGTGRGQRLKLAK